jgi:hypothetical protein
LGSGPLDVGDWSVVPRSEHLSKYTHIAAGYVGPARLIITDVHCAQPLVTAPLRIKTGLTR